MSEGRQLEDVTNYKVRCMLYFVRFAVFRSRVI
jgi:hypothetical protein